MAQAVAGAIPAHIIAGLYLWIASQTIAAWASSLDFIQSILCRCGCDVLVCVLASFVVVRKVMSVEPAAVFKG